MCSRWSLRQGIISKHSTAASLSPQQASYSSPFEAQFLNVLRPRRCRRSRHNIHSSQGAAILHALPSLLRARGATQLMLPSPRALLCVFESSAALLTEAGVLLETCRALRRASMRCPSLLEGAAASCCALPLAAEGKRGHSTHALFASWVYLVSLSRQQRRSQRPAYFSALLGACEARECPLVPPPPRC